MKKMCGVTLLELMICVVIIGILTSIVYPVYIDYIRKGQRIDAMNSLLSYQLAQEKYRSHNVRYAEDFKVLVGSSTKKIASPNGYYQISMGETTAMSYRIFATPEGKQKEDITCGTFAINHNGPDFSKGYASPACWNL